MKKPFTALRKKTTRWIIALCVCCIITPAIHSILPTAKQVNQEMIKLDQEYSHRYVRRVFDNMENIYQWGEFNMGYGFWRTFTSEASLYFSNPKSDWGFFIGTQVYILEAIDVPRSTQNSTVYSPGETYIAEPFGANLIVGAHHRFFPGSRIFGGFMISSARASRLLDDEARQANQTNADISPGNVFSRGFIPFVEYEHPWAKTVKTKADVALNPSDIAAIAQWGLKLLLDLEDFELHGEVDDVKTLGGRQTMVGIRGYKAYTGSGPDVYHDGTPINYGFVRVGRLTRTYDSQLSYPEIQSLQSGNYAVAELWHNFLIAGISYVENIGAGARIGAGRKKQGVGFEATMQYKYLMSDIYGARIDMFSIYFSILANNLF